MKNHIRPIFATLMVAIAFPLVAGGQSPAAALFTEGLMLERAEGRLREALLRYERVVSEFPTERAIVAQALMKLGDGYEQLGKPEASQVYERIVREHPDSGAVVTDARARLAAMPQAAQAAKAMGITSRRVLSGPGADQFGSVSRDGRYLSFMDPETGDLALRDLATGELRRVTNNSTGSQGFAEYSVFSPDAGRLAYEWLNKDGTYELRAINRDGSGLRRLYVNEQVGWLMPYCFSPDGRDILTILARNDNTRQLALVSADKGSVRVLITLDWLMGVPSEVAFSPDGRFVAYDRQGDVFVIAADGSSEAPLVTGSANDRLLGWFPDGRAVLFSSDRAGSPGAWTISVSDGKHQGEPRLLKPDIGARVTSKGFTKNGDLFYHQTIGVGKVYVAGIDPVTGRVTEAPAELRGGPSGERWNASWSPSGEEIAYSIGGPYQRLIGIHDVKTGIVRTVPIEMSYLAPPPTWAPDGRALVVGGTDLKSRQGIFTVDLTTRSAVKLVEGELISEGQSLGSSRLSPDGTVLFYKTWVAQPSGPLEGVFVARNLASNQEIDLRRQEGLIDFQVSFDGRFLAYRVNEPAEGTGSLQVMPSTGGEAKTILRDKRWEIRPGAGFAWSADGKYVLLNRGGEVWRVPVNGDAPQKLDIKLPGMVSISVNPDGRRLAIVSADTSEEVWVMENLTASVGASR